MAIDLLLGIVPVPLKVERSFQSLLPKTNMK